MKILFVSSARWQVTQCLQAHHCVWWKLSRRTLSFSHTHIPRTTGGNWNWKSKPAVIDRSGPRPSDTDASFVWRFRQKEGQTETRWEWETLRTEDSEEGWCLFWFLISLISLFMWVSHRLNNQERERSEEQETDTSQRLDGGRVKCVWSACVSHLWEDHY